MDEWGRSLQKIQINITPSLKSLATYQEYDAMGNPTKTWLPVKNSVKFGKNLYCWILFCVKKVLAFIMMNVIFTI